MLSILFVLDGEHERAARWPAVPPLDTTLVFGPGSGQWYVCARVVELFYLEGKDLWEVQLARDCDRAMSAGEAELWRKVGFDVPEPPPVVKLAPAIDAPLPF